MKINRLSSRKVEKTLEIGVITLQKLKKTYFVRKRFERIQELSGDLIALTEDGWRNNKLLRAFIFVYSSSVVAIFNDAQSLLLDLSSGITFGLTWRTMWGARYRISISHM